eukprot:5951111-Pyramimonas_sp.AAC.1
MFVCPQLAQPPLHAGSSSSWGGARTCCGSRFSSEATRPLALGFALLSSAAAAPSCRPPPRERRRGVSSGGSPPPGSAPRRADENGVPGVRPRGVLLAGVTASSAPPPAASSSTSAATWRVAFGKFKCYLCTRGTKTSDQRFG